MDLFNTVAGTASIIGLVLAIAGVGGYTYFKNKNKSHIQKINGNGNIQIGRDLNIKK